MTKQEACKIEEMCDALMSHYLKTECEVLHVARSRAADVIIINDNAATKVPETCKWLREEYLTRR